MSPSFSAIDSPSFFRIYQGSGHPMMRGDQKTWRWPRFSWNHSCDSFLAVFTSYVCLQGTSSSKDNSQRKALCLCLSLSLFFPLSVFLLSLFLSLISCLSQSFFTNFICLFWCHTWQCSGVTLDRLGLPYGMPGMEPRSAACKVNTLPLCYLSGLTYQYFKGVPPVCAHVLFPLGRVFDSSFCPCWG